MYQKILINKLNETKTPTSTPTSTPAPSSTNKKEIINNIISKKKGRGFYDIHT